MQEELITFGPEEDNRVPGELILKLTTEGNLSVTESVPPGPIRRVAGPLPTSLGIDNLDEALTELGVESISKIHTPISSLTIAAREVGTFAADMGATYRLRFADPEADLDAAASRLVRFKAVKEASPNFFRFSQMIPNDPMYGTQWGLVRINCPDAWDRTKGSTSTIVAVVDTGVDLDHPDLQAQLLPGYDAVDLAGVSPKPGWHFEGDFLTRDNNPQDEVGHGTHVAGTIAAVTDNNVGVAGVTWFCKILPVKVLARMVRNSDGAVTGVGTATDIATGIRWAADHGAHIINLSLGGYNDTFVERDAVAYAVGQGCLLVAAMCNDDVSDPCYPAAYPDVVSVGAINQNDERVSKANTGGWWGSNMGPHIDVMAPGLNIRSTDWDNAYSNKSGTSMATPHVSGVAALIKACRTSWSAADIADVLRDTAQSLKDDPSDPVPNDRYGYGLVDAEAAVKRSCFFFKPPLTDLEKPPWLDIKLKFTDDWEWPPMPKLKFLDDWEWPMPKLKFIDDREWLQERPPKQKLTEDRGAPTSPQVQRPRRPAPFVLATPHHSMAWARSYPQAYQATIARYEAMIAQYEAILAEMQKAHQRGELDETEVQEFEALSQQYQALLAEYQQIRQGGQ